MQPWLLTKLNLCIQDVQEWMSSSMLKLNLDKSEFIIFGSHAQLRKLDPYLPIRIFDYFMHPAVVVMNLRVWFDANFSFADHVHNFCKDASFNCVILGGLDSI